jgi:hypothetical protein
MQMLRDIPTDPSLDVDTLAKRTDGLSGSDLRELCRNAALIPVRDYMRHKTGDEDLEEEKAKAKRGVRYLDIKRATRNLRTDHHPFGFFSCSCFGCGRCAFPTLPLARSSRTGGRVWCLKWSTELHTHILSTEFRLFFCFCSKR